MTNPLGEQPATTKITANGITIEIDLRQVLEAVDPQGKYVGYDPDDDEDHFVQTTLHEELIHATSLLLVKGLRREVLDAIKEATVDEVKRQLRDLIETTLIAPVQRTNEFGGKIGEPTSLREMIMASANDILTKPTGDGYNSRRPTVIQKIIDEQVGAQFRKELQGEVDKAKAEALAAVKDQAGAVIAEAVRRATPGL